MNHFLAVKDIMGACISLTAMYRISGVLIALVVGCNINIFNCMESSTWWSSIDIIFTVVDFFIYYEKNCLAGTD